MKNFAVYLYTCLFFLLLRSALGGSIQRSCYWDDSIYDVYYDSSYGVCPNGQNLVINSLLESAVISTFAIDLHLNITERDSVLYWYNGDIVLDALLRDDVAHSMGFRGYPTFKQGSITSNRTRSNSYVCERPIMQSSPVFKPCIPDIQVFNCESNDSIGAIDDHCYIVLPEENITWTEAQGLCMQRGGYLATINSYNENALLINMTKDIENAVHWIGLSSGFGDHLAFQWAVTGEPFEFGKSFHVSPWSIQEPEGNLIGNMSEDCVVIFIDHWADFFCTNVGQGITLPLKAICEIELSEPTPPTVTYKPTSSPTSIPTTITPSSLPTLEPTVVPTEPSKDVVIIGTYEPGRSDIQISGNLIVLGNATFDDTILEFKNSTVLIQVEGCISGSYSIDIKNIEEALVTVKQLNRCRTVLPKIVTSENQCISSTKSTSYNKFQILTFATKRCSSYTMIRTCFINILLPLMLIFMYL